MYKRINTEVWPSLLLIKISSMVNCPIIDSIENLFENDEQNSVNVLMVCLNIYIGFPSGTEIRLCFTSN